MNWTNIDGWCDFDWLYKRVVDTCPRGSTFVETGTWKGKSTMCMAELIKQADKDIRFLTVDTFIGEGGEASYAADGTLQAEKTLLPTFLKNRAECGLEKYVQYLVSDSVIAASKFEDGILDFIFLDSSHQEEYVYNELMAWYPKLKTGGILAGHDQHHPPIQAALSRFCSKFGLTFHTEGSCWMVDIPAVKSISVALVYCTNDHRFLKSCIDHVSTFAKEIVVVSCDHYWNGEVENLELLKQDAKDNPNAQFVTFEYNPKWDTMQHNVMARRIGCAAFEKPTDYILFLDADEIIDSQKITKWWKEQQSNLLDCYKFANYWYFREACYRSTRWEDSVVLVKNDPSCINENTFDASQSGDRNAFFDKNPTNRKARMVTFGGNPFVHHYSWVRTKDAMLQKVRSWGHSANLDWSALVRKEFDQPWRGKDVLFPERNLTYETIEPYVTL